VPKTRRFASSAPDFRNALLLASATGPIEKPQSLEKTGNSPAPDTSAGWYVTRMNQASMYFNAAEKVRNARDASDLRPIETTYRQMGVERPDLGSTWWKNGMPKSYKWNDRHIFTELKFNYARYVGSCPPATCRARTTPSCRPMFGIRGWISTETSSFRRTRSSWSPRH